MLDPRQLQCSFRCLVDNTELIKFHKMSTDEAQVLGRDKKASRKWLYCLTILEILLLLTAGYLIYRSAKFHMISRKDWGAVEPIYKNLLGLPVPNVVIDENPFECNTTESCIFYLKELQHYRIESTLFADIDSNFYIGGDGLIYEGTGWHINPMPMGIVYHEVSYISICVLGKLNKMETVQRQYNAIRRLAAEGVRLENIEPDYNLYSRHQFDKNGNTGSMLYDLIQKSNHFSTNISWLYPKF
nr:peptidoglycan-recognition protein LF-like [Drosophila kikkawai]